MRTSKKTLILGLIGTCYCLSNDGALAEGGKKRTNGNWGVNRRVITQKNYREISGTFSMTFGHPQKIITRDDGRQVAAYTQEVYQDRASPYMGGGIGNTYEVDAGFQFNGLFPYEDSDETHYDAGKEQGWTIFMRSTNSTTTAEQNGYCNIKYWRAKPTAAEPWAGESVPWTVIYPRSLKDVYLGYRIYGGDDATTPSVVEGAGWMGLTTNIFPIAGGAKYTVFWRRTQNYKGTVTNVNNKVDEETTLTATGTGPTPGDGWITVADHKKLEVDFPVKVGAQTVAIIGVNDTTKRYTIRPALSGVHNSGEKVIQSLDCTAAYRNHPVAPWRGTPTLPTTPAELTEFTVKRVIAMTRWNKPTELLVGKEKPSGFKDELDGSWLTSLFTDGQVRPYNVAKSEPWTAAHTLQVPVDKKHPEKMTGYDTPENGATNDANWDQRVNNGISRMRRSQTTVEFPSLVIAGKDDKQANIEGRTASNLSMGAVENTASGQVSRYQSEHVNINLRTAARLQGEAIEIPRN